MEKAKVYFTDLRTRAGQSQLRKLGKLIRTAGIGEIDFERKLVAIKLHFGEPGNLSYLRPNWAKVVVDEVKARGGMPFLTDCNTLYPGQLKNAYDHLNAAYENGFTPFSTGCHVIIGDGVKGIGFNKGGTVALGGARVTMVNACHSSSVSGPDGPRYAGAEAGFMIAGEGHTIYVSGDTDIMADMGWMGEYHKPDIGILSAGGHYTMDMARATFAARKYFNFKTVIPCHYRTFPLLAQDARALKSGLPGVEVIEPQVLEPLRF